MDTSKIATFVDLAATLSFTTTAENLYLTQATVSKHIQSLEKELGVKLFARTQHSVELTAAGQAMLNPARNLVADDRGIRNAIEVAQNQDERKLRVSTIPTIANYHALAALTSFHQLHPELQLQIQDEESNNLRGKLDRGATDIIFTRTFSGEDSDLEQIPTETDAFVAIMPRDHPLAKAKAIDFGQLASDNLLVLGETSNMYRPFLALTQLAGFRPQITYNGERIDLILDLVNSGMGIGVLMAKSASLQNHPALVKVPLRQQVTSQLVFARKPGHHAPASEQLWQFLAYKFA